MKFTVFVPGMVLLPSNASAEERAVAGMFALLFH